MKSLKKLLVSLASYTHEMKVTALKYVSINQMYEHNCFTDKMVRNELLQGVPLLVLANKQDLPDCMGVREVKPIFNQSAHLIGSRDCMVMPVSALTG